MWLKYANLSRGLLKQKPEWQLNVMSCYTLANVQRNVPKHVCLKCSHEHKNRTNWNKNVCICISVWPVSKMNMKKQMHMHRCPSVFHAASAAGLFPPCISFPLKSCSVAQSYIHISHAGRELPTCSYKYTLIWRRILHFFIFLTTWNRLNINPFSGYSVMQKI